MLQYHTNSSDPRLAETQQHAQNHNQTRGGRRVNRAEIHRCGVKEAQKYTNSSSTEEKRNALFVRSVITAAVAWFMTVR